jgi:hypothetical protein
MKERMVLVAACSALHALHGLQEVALDNAPFRT